MTNLNNRSGLGNAGVASVAFCVAIATAVAATWLKRQRNMIVFSFHSVGTKWYADMGPRCNKYHPCHVQLVEIATNQK